MVRALATALTLSALTLVGPNEVDAAPSFPVAVAVDYCWDFTWPSDPCDGTPGTGVGYDTFTLDSDGTWSSGQGFTGIWSYQGSRNFQLRIVFDSGTTYIGRHLGGGALEGPMQSPTGRSGTWAGQVRL